MAGVAQNNLKPQNSQVLCRVLPENGRLAWGGGVVPAVVSWPRRRRISIMALYRSPLASQNWGEQPEYSQAPTAPADEVGAGLLPRPGPPVPSPPRNPAQARLTLPPQPRPGPPAPHPSTPHRSRTQQHHDVPELERGALPGPDPFHLGHPGPLAFQPGELLVTGGRSANISTTWVTGPAALRAAGAEKMPGGAAAEHN